MLGALPNEEGCFINFDFDKQFYEVDNGCFSMEKRDWKIRT